MLINIKQCSYYRVTLLWGFNFQLGFLLDWLKMAEGQFQTVKYSAWFGETWAEVQQTHSEFGWRLQQENCPSHAKLEAANNYEGKSK